MAGHLADDEHELRDEHQRARRHDAPDVHLIEGQWVMFIGGFSATFRNRLYRAHLTANADEGLGNWVLDRRPLVADPPKGAWDVGGMHTPSYVPGHGGFPPRIYYAGRASSRHYGRGSSYSIGVSLLAIEASGRDARHPC